MSHPQPVPVSKSLFPKGMVEWQITFYPYHSKLEILGKALQLFPLKQNIA